MKTELFFYAWAFIIKRGKDLVIRFNHAIF
jgi:hypothetical protein